MPQNNGNPSQRVEIPINFRYQPKEDIVELWISPFVMVKLPFPVLKNGLDEIEKVRGKKDIVSPNSRIIMPGT